MQHQSMTDKVKNVLGGNHTHTATDHHNYGIGAPTATGHHGTTTGTGYGHTTGTGYGTTGHSTGTQPGGLLGKVEAAVMGHGTHGTHGTGTQYGTTGTGYGTTGADYGHTTGTGYGTTGHTTGTHPGGILGKVEDAVMGHRAHGTHGTGSTGAGYGPTTGTGYGGTHGTHGTSVPHTTHTTGMHLSLAEKAKLKLTGHL